MRNLRCVVLHRSRNNILRRASSSISGREVKPVAAPVAIVIEGASAAGEK